MSYFFRRFLLFCIIFIFLCAAPLVIFYARGYRFDLHNLEFTKTGTLSVKTAPSGADIYLDGKIYPKASPAKIDGLKPKDYALRVTREGYQDWQASFTIKPELVTSATHIILFPQQLEEKNIISGSIDNFALSPDQQKIIYNIAKGEKRGLWIFYFGTEENIKISDIYFEDFDWSGNGQKIILKRKEESGLRYGLLDLGASGTLKNNPKIQDLASLVRDPIEKISWSPDNSQRLFILAKDNLYEADLGKPAISLLQKNVQTYAFHAYGLLWVQKDQKNVFLAAQDYRLLNRPEIITALPKRETYKIIPSPGKIALLLDHDLYFVEDGALVKIAEAVEDASWSPDNKRLLYFNAHQINSYYLKDATNSVLTRDSRILENINWWPRSQYVVFVSKEKLKFIDAAPEMNSHWITEIKNTKVPQTKIQWDKNSKNIFLVAENEQGKRNIVKIKLIEN